MSGGADRLIISRNNSARPQDRVYFRYENLTGGLTGVAMFPGVNRTESASLDRYTIGIEKTFLDGQASIEMRLPFASQRDFDFGTAYSARNTNYQGDISLIGKGVISESDNWLISSGIAVQLPSAGNVTGTDGTATFTVDHDAIYVSPFLSFEATQGDWFYNGFLQADFNVAGDGFSASNVSATAGSFQTGTYNTQHLLRASYGGGKWFHKNSDREWFRGLAGIVEVHYTSTLNDTDRVNLTGPTTGRVLQNEENRQDFVNLTAGLHVELRDNVNSRIGVSVPLRDSDRQYDATFLVQVDILLR